MHAAKPAPAAFHFNNGVTLTPADAVLAVDQGSRVAYSFLLSGASSVASVNEDGVKSAYTRCIYGQSPIALDIDHSGAVERIQGQFSIDLTGDGELNNVSEWFAPTEGILIDTRIEIVQGQITGHHLFGDMDGAYTDGFEKLALLDANGDGQIARGELAGLAIWTDANSNAILDRGEISGLAEHQVVRLGTTHTNYISSAQLADGSSMVMEDVWFPVFPVAAGAPVNTAVAVALAAAALVAVATTLAGRNQSRRNEEVEGVFVDA